MAMNSTSTTPLVPRIGHWLPANHDIIRHWLSNLIEYVDSHKRDLDSVLQEFQDFIEGDEHVEKLACLMFKQVPNKAPYDKDPTGKPQVRDYRHMFRLFNEILVRAPEWSKAADEVGLIGFPINAIIDWPMGTEAGFEFFKMRHVNRHFKNVLNKWAEFLSSGDSTHVLNEDEEGWFSPEAIKALEDKGNNVVSLSTEYTFEQLYICDPSAKHLGFKSWDDFFTRKFCDGIRPVASPEENSVIVNACESAPWRRSENVQLKDEFWLKEQPYSLIDIMNGDDLASEFAGGTVYQAFLSALSYHRWHSPVDGKVLKILKIPGTYYSENRYEGFPDPDPAGPDRSQGYIAEVATRSVIFIKAENDSIGLMCIVHIGMSEVSSCEYTVAEGYNVTKGEEIGMFHYGGSTHCLIFRPEVNLKWSYDVPDGSWDAGNIPVNSVLAVVDTSM
ncbi:phosphatidylserine decarboxylase family protein [Glonium stellatum]|uniref:Phosphatidylserine decarboxylase family protein n=1 Tax=Glonium stellatum TaxID=574774 RepID=A0A8E2EYN9_9PEZI|nr:phosphatidylserine decarboxylase family protein [Glonium stellatum]